MAGRASRDPYPSYEKPNRNPDRPAGSEQLFKESKMTFTADDARRMFVEATDVNGEIARKETAAILAQIEIAARQAERSVSADLPWKHRDLIIKRLQANGFAVKVFEDQREGNYMIVSW